MHSPFHSTQSGWLVGLLQELIPVPTFIALVKQLQKANPTTHINNAHARAHCRNSAATHCHRVCRIGLFLRYASVQLSDLLSTCAIWKKIVRAIVRLVMRPRKYEL